LQVDGQSRRDVDIPFVEPLSAVCVLVRGHLLEDNSRGRLTLCARN
jgi:hypothetical protein